MGSQGRSTYGDVFNDEANDEEPKFPSSTFPGVDDTGHLLVTEHPETNDTLVYEEDDNGFGQHTRMMNPLDFEQNHIYQEPEHDEFHADVDSGARIEHRSEHKVDPPSQPNSRDAADTLAQFASRLQGETYEEKVQEENTGNGKRGSRSSTGGTWVSKRTSGRHAAAAAQAAWASPEKKRRITVDASAVGLTSPPANGSILCDSHFIVHLFVTAIAGGKLQQGNLPQKTWDVLQQVVTKVSKEQNTTVTLHGTTLEFKMRVFVCNSVEARAVGEYITTHASQTPAPFVVLARQLSMAIAYNSDTLDPTQAAVADRLRKQAKTRAVKEIREAVRECQVTITADMLRGHHGALAPVKELEPQLSKRSAHVDLEGDPNRRYFFFDAKNRCKDDGDLVKHTPSSSGGSARSRGGTATASPHTTTSSRYPPTPLSPVLARVQGQSSPKSPLSPGGRDGAAALISLFNAVSAPDGTKRSGRIRANQALLQQQQQQQQGYLGCDDHGAEADSMLGAQVVACKKANATPNAPKQSLAAQAAANVIKSPSSITSPDKRSHDVSLEHLLTSP